MQNTIIKIFITICLVLIMIPFVFVILKIKVDPVNKVEKKISLNFKRNFPLRSDLFKIYAKYKQTFFEAEPIPYGVIDTKNGWKFLGNKFSNALSESKGLIVFTPLEIETLKRNLLVKKEWLATKNIQFYISVAPNKHTVYGDMIPIKKSPRNTKFQQLDSLCTAIGISFIDMGRHFPKEDSLRLYNKTDSHWNHLGGFYGFTATLEEIRKDFKNTNFIAQTQNDIEIEKYWVHMGDLNRALFQVQNEEFINVKPKGCFHHEREKNKLTPPSDYHFGARFYEERYQSSVNDLKIMVLRDSFFGAYFEFIADNFGSSLFVWRHNFNKELITSESPDILCYEIVERNIDIFLTENFEHSPN